MPIPKSDTSVERLFEGAQGYCDSMEILAYHPYRSSLEAIGLLAAHSLELALKSFLMRNGWTEKVIRKEVGHDLNRAWIEAANCGLAISIPPPYWVEVLALGHGYPYVFRYPQNNTAIAVPTLEELILELKSLISLCRAQ